MNRERSIRRGEWPAALANAAVFALVKGLNELRKRFAQEQEKSPAPPSQSEVYLKEIRDALVKK